MNYYTYHITIAISFAMATYEFKPSVLPIEIWGLICKDLNKIDIIVLTLTSKAFRDMIKIDISDVIFSSENPFLEETKYTGSTLLHIKKNISEYNRPIDPIMMSKYFGIRLHVVTDLSPFRNAKYVNISYESYTDISQLTGCERINMSGTLISDLSPLKNVKILQMNNCFNVRSFKGLENIEHIEFNGCVVTAGYECLNTATTIIAYDTGVCPRDVSIFKNVRKLWYSEDDNKTGIDTLKERGVKVYLF